ncbi:choline kinase [[Candida] railenensis]|uniref:Choline kinase n=1 Tax=[Candida] railenensis TaxID=45579 RepID=A0A9P0QS73_9ASCO|nr:choline kinase [[Candida] railenensis]
MEITPSNIHQSTRSRSRSRTRNSTANSRSTSSSRRPSLGPHRRSLSSSSLNKLVVKSTQIESQEKAIPTTTATLDNSLPIDFFKQDLITLIKALKISKWHKQPLEKLYLSINRISGALTNSIYKLEYKDHSNGLVLPALLLRVYGKNVDSIIDRESELKTLIKLSQKKIGPRLLGIFANGRFEQFLEGYITLNKDQIRDEVISQMIGRRMKELHYKISLEPEELESDLPMSWKWIHKWLDLLEEQLLEAKTIDPNFNEEDVFFMPFAKFVDLIETYREWLFDKYDRRNFADNYRFCHNDTQYGNLLLHESFNPNEIVLDRSGSESQSKTNSRADLTELSSAASSSTKLSAAASNAAPSGATLVTSASLTDLKSTTNKKDTSLAVIDFEYSGCSFAALDLVNHFSEWMANYHDPERSYYIEEQNYPNKIQQINFIKSYIEYDFQFPSSNLKISHSGDISRLSATDLIELEIKKLYNECILWRSTVQFFWALWGLIQNGPFVNKGNVPASQEEVGIDGKYSITTELENLQVDDDGHVEDITSSDDEFEYLKYSQQKIALILGDLIQFGLFSKSDLSEENLAKVKWLDVNLFDV